MNISAVLHPQSNLSREWRSRRLPFANFRGIVFTAQGHEYVADNITPAQAALLQPCGWFVIEAVTTPITKTSKPVADMVKADPPLLSEESIFSQLKSAPGA